MLMTQVDTIASCLQQLTVTLRYPISTQYDTLSKMIRDWEDSDRADKMLTFEAVAVARSLTAIHHVLGELAATLKTVREQLSKQGMQLR